METAPGIVAVSFAPQHQQVFAVSNCEAVLRSWPLKRRKISWPHRLSHTVIKNRKKLTLVVAFFLKWLVLQSLLGLPDLRNI